MKITKLEKFFLPCGYGSWLFVKLSTDEGIDGYGEGTLVWQEKSVAAFLDDFISRYVIGANPFNIEAIWNKLYRNQYEGGPVAVSAISAVEIACWDIVGRYLQQPIYNLLGGEYKNPLRAYANGWYGGTRECEVIAKQAKAVAKKGYSALKFDPFGRAWKELNKKELFLSLELVAAVRDAVGKDMDIIIEGHGRLSFNSALDFAREAEKFDLLWFEEPVCHENIELLSEFRSKTNLRIAGGERIWNFPDFARLIERHAVDVLQFDVVTCGGILAAKKIAAMAWPNDIMIAPHCAVGPIAFAATLQVAATLPNLLIQESFHEFSAQWHGPMTNNWNPVSEGQLHVPHSPGLGISINEQAMQNQSPAKGFPSLWDDWYEAFGSS